LGGGDAINGCKTHDDLVHEGAVLNAVKRVLGTVSEQTCLRTCRQRLVEAHAHHCVILLCLRFGIDLAGLAKPLTCSLQRGLVDLAIAFDDVNVYTRAVGEDGDLLGALVLSHCSGAIEDGLGEDDGLTSGHVETIGKSHVVKWCNSLLVDV
jgi:hypothetical protein